MREELISFRDKVLLRIIRSLIELWVFEISLGNGWIFSNNVPKGFKGCPNEIQNSIRWTKANGSKFYYHKVKFYPQSELMNPFDPHV